MTRTKILFTIDDKYSPHWQITPTYSTEGDAMVDFERFTGGYHNIFSQAKNRGDEDVHELWSANHDEYWFWMNSTPWPKIHVKMSNLK
ncbi:hypothetical protein [Limosilactobacillus reuteri]|uniref:hypothetical protein n=1 Tax=Limosilactobacillus reuteri TaxID=1598 RepID=UPI0021BB8C3D|nr:hypothetical protein [Limosilactobacillus reuteri]UXE90188.1 hypothetical protein N4560_04850 [Limosilactobacillus reuteri]